MPRLINAVGQTYYGDLNASLDYQDGAFVWGKAIVDGDNFKAISSALSCKDYLVDMYYRGSTAFDQSHNITDEQKRSNCYWIATSPTTIRRMEETIRTVLNPYEKKHGLKRTKLIQPEYDPTDYTSLGERRFVIIQGSDMWTRNCVAISFYLSLIRLCAYDQTWTIDNLENLWEPNKYRVCNEHTYFAYMQPVNRQVYNWFYNHPREMMMKPTDTQDITLYQKGSATTHGVTGLFFILQHTLTHNVQGTIFRPEHPIANKIRELYNNPTEL